MSYMFKLPTACGWYSVCAQPNEADGECWVDDIRREGTELQQLTRWSCNVLVKRASRLLIGINLTEIALAEGRTKTRTLRCYVCSGLP